MPFTYSDGEVDRTANLNNLKVPVFSNINDQPVAPTQSKAGNGSDLISRFNNLSSILDTIFIDIYSRIQRIATLAQSSQTTSLQNQLNSVQSTVNNLQTTINTVEARANSARDLGFSLQTQVSTLENNVEAIDIAALQAQVNALQNAVTSLQNTSGSSQSTTKILTYASDGDTNGVCYWIGTNYGAETWVNPHVAGRLLVTLSSAYNADNNNPDALVNRNGDDGAATADTSGSSVTLDLGASRKLNCNGYSIRGNKYSPSFPRYWKLQGSNDSTSFVDLDNQVNNSAINTNNWFSTAILNTVEYRYFRILQTSANASNNQILALSEIELYGTLKY